MVILISSPAEKKHIVRSQDGEMKRKKSTGVSLLFGQTFMILLRRVYFCFPFRYLPHPPILSLNEQNLPKKTPLKEGIITKPSSTPRLFPLPPPCRKVKEHLEEMLGGTVGYSEGIFG